MFQLVKNRLPVFIITEYRLLLPINYNNIMYNIMFNLLYYINFIIIIKDTRLNS